MTCHKILQTQRNQSDIISQIIITMIVAGISGALGAILYGSIGGLIGSIGSALIATFEIHKKCTVLRGIGRID